MENKIIEFINIIADDLGIDSPPVSVDASGFKTKTGLAYCDGSTIFLRSAELVPELFLALAHELRHLWQIKNNKAFYFSNYKDNSILDIEAYNLQPAEVDANAYAAAVMVDFFSIKPLFQGLPESVVDAIYSRIDEILNE